MIAHNVKQGLKNYNYIILNHVLKSEGRGEHRNNEISSP